jgi:hypothetical protein
MSYICGTTVSRSKNAAPNEYGHLWEEIEQNRPSTVKEKFKLKNPAASGRESSTVRTFYLILICAR